MRRILFELFSETGELSCMRVMAMIALLSAIGLAYLGKNDCVPVLITAAFAAKVTQRYVEK